MLWKGETTSYYGDFYLVENARIYTLPERPVPIIVAAEGPKMAVTAGKIGDGLMSTTPDKSLIEKFNQEGGIDEAPCYGQATVCYAKDEATARKITLKQWPIPAIPGELNRELPTPKFFEATAKLVTEDMLAGEVAFGPDPEKHIEVIKKFLDAGYRKVSIHNVGPNQEDFFRLYKEKVIPAIQNL